MNFSPENRATLETLLSSLGNGLSANTAYPILQQTIAAQEQQVQQRKEQMQNYAQQVAGLAQSGMPMGATTTMMDLLTPKPGVPPKVSSMIGTAYPSQDLGPLGGQEPINQSVDQWLRFNQQAGNIPNPQDQLSPLYTQSPEVQAQLQQAMMPPQPTTEQQDLAAIAEITSGIRDLRMKGYGDDVILQRVMSDPLMYGTYIKNAELILSMAGGYAPDSPLAPIMSAPVTTPTF